jgi:hypothetical protein
VHVAGSCSFHSSLMLVTMIFQAFGAGGGMNLLILNIFTCIYSSGTSRSQLDATGQLESRDTIPLREWFNILVLHQNRRILEEPMHRRLILWKILLRLKFNFLI